MHGCNLPVNKVEEVEVVTWKQKTSHLVHLTIHQRKIESFQDFSQLVLAVRRGRQINAIAGRMPIKETADRSCELNVCTVRINLFDKHISVSNLAH